VSLKPRFVCQAPQQPTRSLDEHCHMLGDLLHSSAAKHGKQQDQEWVHASKWLGLGSDVRRVEIVTSYFDDAPMCCDSVLELEKARSEVTSDFYTELTRFLFAWSAFETVVGIVQPPGWNKHGKVRASGQFQKEKFEPESLMHYWCAIEGMRRRARFQPSAMQIEEPQLTPSGSYEISGVGLRLVYGLRNSFSHGSAGFPEPEDWGGKPNIEMQVIRGSTRIVLYTIQMMLIAYLNGSRASVQCRFDGDDSEPQTVRDLYVRDLLRNIYIKRPITIL